MEKYTIQNLDGCEYQTKQIIKQMKLEIKKGIFIRTKSSLGKSNNYKYMQLTTEPKHTQIETGKGRQFNSNKWRLQYSTVN